MEAASPGFGLRGGTNTLIYGNPFLNSGGQDQLAVLNAVGPKAVPNELVASWEDNINFKTWPQLNDYNDLGMTMSNTKAVPEPSSMSAMAIAGLTGFGFVRRKKMATKPA